MKLFSYLLLPILSIVGIAYYFDKIPNLIVITVLFSILFSLFWIAPRLELIVGKITNKIYELHCRMYSIFVENRPRSFADEMDELLREAQRMREESQRLSHLLRSIEIETETDSRPTRSSRTTRRSSRSRPPRSKLEREYLERINGESD